MKVYDFKERQNLFDNKSDIEFNQGMTLNLMIYVL